MLGTLPPAANERINNDKMSIPSSVAGDLPRQVLTALANGLQVKIGDRTQSMVKFRDELVYGDTSDNLQKAEAKRNAQAATTPVKDISSNTKTASKPKKSKSGFKYAAIAAGVTAGLFVAIIAVAMIALPKIRNAVLGNTDTKNKQSASSSQSSSSKSDSKKEETTSSGPSEVEYAVPDLVGKKYSEVMREKNKNSESDYENFKIVISEHIYSDKYKKGEICSQSIEPYKNDKKVTKPKGTEIKVVVSLGPEKISVPKLVGKTKEEALISLFEKGFNYDNIKITESTDPSADYKKVLGQKPSAGQSISPDETIEIDINNYQPPEDDKQEEDE